MYYGRMKGIPKWRLPSIGTCLGSSSPIVRAPFRWSRITVDPVCMGWRWPSRSERSVTIAGLVTSTLIAYS
jgi:hypothetical protein